MPVMEQGKVTLLFDCTAEQNPGLNAAISLLFHKDFHLILFPLPPLQSTDVLQPHYSLKLAHYCQTCTEGK